MGMCFTILSRSVPQKPILGAPIALLGWEILLSRQLAFPHNSSSHWV